MTTKNPTTSVSPEVLNMLRAGYNLMVCGNGDIGGKWSGWRVSGDGHLTSPEGDVFSVAFLRMIGREFAIRGTPLTRRRSKQLRERALRQDFSALARMNRDD